MTVTWPQELIGKIRRARSFSFRALITPDPVKMKEHLAIAYWISWAYVFLNVCIGMYLLHERARLHGILTGNVITFTYWGVLFLFFAALLAFNLVFNHWQAVRQTHIAAFTIKLFWGIILFFVAVRVGVWPILASMGFWLTLAAIQGILVIYLYPREEAIKDVGKITR